MNILELQNFLIAVAIGGLIGLEREIGIRERDKSIFAGFRTFILISFFGALSYFIESKLQIPHFSAISFILFSILIIVTYYISARKGFIGITSELTSIITFLLGILVMQNEYKVYAVVFAVLITILLAFKKYVRLFIKKAKIQEWYDTLKFAFIAFVILPLLPNRYFGPYNFFNPYQTWLLVVFVSGISFLGYFAIKFFGPKLGVSLSGLLGGLVSSTGVTNTMANRSKSAGEKAYRPFVIATILASSVMFIRVLFEVSAVNPGLVKNLVVPMSAMLAVGLISTLFWWRTDTAKDKAKLDLKSPFSLQPALLFAIFFLGVQLIEKLVLEFGFGDLGIMVTSVVAGLTDVDAITLAMSNLARAGTVSNPTASIAIIAAVLTNTIVKGTIAWIWGGKKFRTRVAGVIGVMVAAGVISIVLST